MLDRPAISEGQRGRAIILVLLVGVIWVIAVLAVLPWLRATFGVPVAIAIGAAVALSLMAYFVRFLIRMHRGLDEVQRASIAFSAQWGQSAAQIGFVVLLLLPLFHEFATTLISRFAGDSGTPIDRQVVGPCDDVRVRDYRSAAGHRVAGLQRNLVGI